MSCACSIRNSLFVGGVLSETTVLSLSNGMKYSFVASITQMCVSPRLCIVSIENSGRSSSRGQLPSSLLGNGESASAAWCFLSAQ